jgi:sugar phosphate isomerase/epimerase
MKNLKEVLIMSKGKISYSIFTKPWRTQSVEELGELVSGLGFNGIEFPLREGYQVEPKNAEKELPKLAKKLARYNLKVTSVASSTDENIFAACADAGIPLIRIMFGAKLHRGYMNSEADMKKSIEEFIPLCEKYSVKVGIQNHYGPGVSNSMEMKHLLEDYDPNYVGAIWDAAHSGLAGEEPEQGLDIAWSHLCLVNLKTAFYKLKTGPEAEEAQFERYFTTGRHGLVSWPRIIKYLCERNYQGIICMPAEYTDEANVNKYIAEDIIYLKELVNKYY